MFERKISTRLENPRMSVLFSFGLKLASIFQSALTNVYTGLDSFPLSGIQITELLALSSQPAGKTNSAVISGYFRIIR